VPEPDAELAPVRAALLAAADPDDAATSTATSTTTSTLTSAATSTTTLPPPSPDPLARAADALDDARALLTAALDGRALTWDVLEAGLEDSYAGGRAAMRAAYARPDDEAFHAWRKRVKDLWYQTQLIVDACEPPLAALAGMLADLGDRLGDDHDLAVLAAQPAAHGLPGLADRIADRRRSLRHDAWILGQQVHAERPRAFLRRVAVYWRVWRSEDPI
jgi:hypothetical protein